MTLGPYRGERLKVKVSTILHTLKEQSGVCSDSESFIRREMLVKQMLLVMTVQIPPGNGVFLIECYSL